MNIIKDLINLTLLSFLLYVLYKTTDDILALLCVITILVCYIFKHLKLQSYIKRELKDQIDLFNLMFNSSKDMILYHDLDYKIKTCNKTFCKTFNIRPEDVENQNARILLKYLLKAILKDKNTL